MKRPYKYVKERKKNKKGKRRNRHPSAHNGEEDPPREALGTAMKKTREAGQEP